MDSTQKLIELFKEFPGIGPRQAKRFVYFLLTRPNGYASELSKLISEVKSNVTCCDSCFRFFTKNNSSSETCPVCANKNRDNKTLMIVSHDVDFENIEKTGSYSGYYFILGGTVPILEKTPERRIRQKELLETVSKKSKEGYVAYPRAVYGGADANATSIKNKLKFMNILEQREKLGISNSSSDNK